MGNCWQCGVAEESMGDSEGWWCAAWSGAEPPEAEWPWLRADCDDPSPIVGVPVTLTDEIQMLGVPLGSQEFVEKFVERELLDTAEGVMSPFGQSKRKSLIRWLVRLCFSVWASNQLMKLTNKLPSPPPLAV